MKNIEKIAIEHLLKSISQFEEISELNNQKKAFEEAKAKFQHSATAVINKANEIASGISNELSEEGVQYLESEVSKLINIPFRLKK